MIFSNYIYLGHGKKFSSHMGIEPKSFRLWVVSTPPLDQRADIIKEASNGGVVDMGVWQRFSFFSSHLSISQKTGIEILVKHEKVALSFTQII